MSTTTEHLHTDEQPAPGPVIQLAGLTKNYGSFTAVDHVDLTVNAGEIVGMLGPNGAGKTTTIDMIVGLQEPTSGTVRVFGLDPAHDRSAFTSRVAVQTQEASLFDSLTVAETLRLFASLHEHPLGVEEVARLTGMDEQAGVKVKKLSGGQARRLLVGVALIGDPDLVVLDEPSAGLDPAARQQLWGVIEGLKERGKTVLITTHHMDEATALCDRVAIIVDGRVAALDSPENLVLGSASSRKVSFTAPPGRELSALSGRPDVEDISVRDTAGGQRITVTTSASDAVIAAIASCPALCARDISVDGGSLEDVFLALAATSDYSSRQTEAPAKRRGNKNSRK